MGALNHGRQAQREIGADARIRQLEAANARLRKDALRYRWMRPHLFTGSDCYPKIETSVDCCVNNPECIGLSGNALDAAIDAAMSRK